MKDIQTISMVLKASATLLAKTLILMAICILCGPPKTSISLQFTLAGNINSGDTTSWEVTILVKMHLH